MPLKPLDQYDPETEILPYVEGVEGSDGQWNFWCPLHDDVGSKHKGYSLSKKGRKLLGNCRSPQCAATLSDLVDYIEGDYSPNGNHADVKYTVTKHSSKKKGIAWWVDKTQIEQEVWESMGVVEEGSGIAFTFEDLPVRKIRKPPKEITWSGTDEFDAPAFWPYPEDKLPEHIWITEGESDAGTIRGAGLGHAFGSTKGAAADLPENAMDALVRRGVSKLTVCGDTDKPGAQFSSAIARRAVDAGIRTFVCDLRTVLDPFSGINDLNSLWKEVDTPEQFKELIERATYPVSKKYEHLTMDDLDVISEEEIPWMLPNLIAPGDKILLAAPQKSYKTFIALDLTRALCDMKPFLLRPEWQGNKRYKVLFIQEEGSRTAWAQRCRRMQLSREGRENFLSMHRRGIAFTDSESIDTVISVVREHQVDLVIFDPLQRMMPGVNENDSSETGIVWDEIMRLQLACPTVCAMVIHHANKTEGQGWEMVRGSSRHAGEVDLGIFLRRDLEEHTVRVSLSGRDIPEYMGTGDYFETKVKVSGEDEDPFMEFSALELKVNITPKAVVKQVNKDKIYIAVEDGCTTVNSIISQTGISDVTVRKNLKELVEEGKVEERDNGKGKPLSYHLLS